LKKTEASAAWSPSPAGKVVVLNCAGLCSNSGLPPPCAGKKKVPTWSLVKSCSPASGYGGDRRSWAGSEEEDGETVAGEPEPEAALLVRAAAASERICAYGSWAWRSTGWSGNW